MPRDRILRLLFEPFLEDRHRLADLAQHAVRQRQELSRLAVLGPERDYLAVARCGLLGALRRVEQNPEVGVRVDVFGIEPDGGRYMASASAGSPAARNSTPRLLWALAWRGSSATARRYDGDRGVEPVVGLEDDAEIAYPVRLPGRQREAALDQREAPRRCVPADVRARRRSAARVDGRARLEHAAVHLVGLDQLPVFLQLDRDRDRLLKRQLAGR